MTRNIHNTSDIAKAAQQAFDSCKEIDGGRNAHYIPFLANVDPKLYALSITLANGKTFDFGDTDYVFGVESISKVFTAILAMRQSGTDAVLQKIGADATGMPFNSILAILLENDQPSTPLVNAGAISACSMVMPTGNPDAKWEAIMANFNDLCGSSPVLLEELYKSETATNFNNRSIAWLLKNFGRIYDDPDMSLDLYTRQCSLGITTRQLSVCAATIAAGGINPVAGKRIFETGISSKITSLIATVGMYQKTGDWMYHTGIPAKSGVGGGILAVVPGIMGVASFSPPLDMAGNSVKGQAVVAELGRLLGINLFGSDNALFVD